MPLFNFSQEELLSFFAVLVRYSVLFSVLPFVGDRHVPNSVKVLLSLSVTLALFPALVSSGEVKPGEALIWGAQAGSIAGTIAMEVIIALVLGFTARMIFESINFGANLVGNFMGFAAASSYDPHQESQSQIIAQLQMAIAMLIFLAIDGHHLMLRAALDSYQWAGIGGRGVFGQIQFNPAFSQKLVEVTGQVFKFGIQIAAPVAICIFAVNVAFGVVAKAMPQLNILVLSFAVTTLLGFAALFMSLPEFTGAVSNLFGRMDDWMMIMMKSLATGK